MTEIRLVSHSGDRAVTGFDRTFETIDSKTVTPLVDIHHEGFGDTWTDRFFEIGGDHFLGGRFEDFLSDAEVDGTTVRFDGEIPHSHEDQCWTRLLVTEDSLFVSVPPGGQHPRRPLAVRRNGRPEVAMRSTSGPGHLDWMLVPRTTRKIVEPLGETEKVTVHDPSVTDLEGYLRESVERSRDGIAEAVKDLRTVADLAERMLAGEEEPRGVPYGPGVAQDLDQHIRDLKLATSLLEG